MGLGKGSPVSNSAPGRRRLVKSGPAVYPRVPTVKEGASREVSGEEWGWGGGGRGAGGCGGLISPPLSPER